MGSIAVLYGKKPKNLRIGDDQAVFPLEFDLSHAGGLLFYGGPLRVLPRAQVVPEELHLFSVRVAHHYTSVVKRRQVRNLTVYGADVRYNCKIMNRR